MNRRERKLFQKYIIIQNKGVSERWQTTLIENKCPASGWFYSQTAHFLKKSGWKSLKIIEICTLKAQKGNKRDILINVVILVRVGKSVHYEKAVYKCK